MVAISNDGDVVLELNTSVRLPAALVERIDVLAAVERRSRSNMIRILIEEALDARERVAP
jgi:metal-responsive CopG/Arc/MetJ family transcriptional regulator